MGVELFSDCCPRGRTQRIYSNLEMLDDKISIALKSITDDTNLKKDFFKEQKDQKGDRCL